MMHVRVYVREVRHLAAGVWYFQDGYWVDLLMLILNHKLRSWVDIKKRAAQFAERFSFQDVQKAEVGLDNSVYLVSDLIVRRLLLKMASCEDNGFPEKVILMFVSVVARNYRMISNYYTVSTHASNAL